MEIPKYISKRKIGYGWDGNDEVWTFTSTGTVDEYRQLLVAIDPLVEKYGDSKDSINYIFKDDSGRSRFQFFVGLVDAEWEDDLDIMAYVGEDEFKKLSWKGATLVGTFFILTIEEHQ